MKPLHAGLLAALALVACSDGTTEPGADVVVTIQRGSVPTDEETIRAGTTIVFTAQVADAAGTPLTRPVSWRSTDAGVATVDGAGLVTGVKDGSTLVIAAAGGAADTVRVNVAEPIQGSVECAPGDGGIRLEVGQVHSASAADATTLCIHGGAAGSEYVYIPFLGGSTGRLGVEVTASDVVAATAPPNPSLAPADPAVSGSRMDRDFHRRLRERVEPGLTQRLRAVGNEPAASYSLALAPPPSVGDRLRLNVETSSQDGCSNPDYRTGRVVAVSRNAVVVADTANPDGFTDAEYAAFGTRFDELVHPLISESFGNPSDIDGNDRVILFFTRAVNDLTRAGSGVYYAGFFFDRDLFPRTGSGACAGSNQAEMFYLMVPDASRAGNGEFAFSKESVRTHTLSVLGHEYQHLVNAARRLQNKAPVWEETWLNEGLSHIAEELLFYRASGFAPRQNQDGLQLSSPAAALAFSAYQKQNVERYIDHLQAGGSPIADDDALSTRGAAWSFLRYVADRRGGAEGDLWRALLNSRTSGLANLQEVLGGTEPMDWMQDWAISAYADDATPVASRYTQPSWNFRVLIPRMFAHRHSRYPVRTVALQDRVAAPLQLPAGGAAYLRFGVPADARAAVRVTDRERFPAPSTLRVAIVRTK